MNRRTFLARIGQAVAAATVAPYVPWGDPESFAVDWGHGEAWGALVALQKRKNEIDTLLVELLYIERFPRIVLPADRALRGDPASSPGGDERPPQ